MLLLNLFLLSQKKKNSQRPPCNAERVAELRLLCGDALCPEMEAKGSGNSCSGNSGSGASLSLASSASSATVVLPSSTSSNSKAALAPPRCLPPPAPTATRALTAPNPHIEHIISLICRLFDVQDALLALLDGERVFIRDAAGKKFKRGDFPWSCSFCGWSLANPTPQTLIVPDARADARFDRNPFVRGPPYMRFYAGAFFGKKVEAFFFFSLCPRFFPPVFFFFRRRFFLSPFSLSSFSHALLLALDKNLLPLAQKK